MSTLELENIKHPDNANTNIALASNGSIIVDRRSTDGTIAEFRKDGTTVGSIGTYNNDIYWGTDDTGLTSSNGMNAIMPFNPSTVAVRDSGIDLGINTVRFKDLYLSGGAYLGGTGAANKLDDYEEGTWVPVPGSSTFTIYQAAWYTKIGNTVTCSCYVYSFGDNSSSTAFTITGLPFAHKTGSEAFFVVPASGGVGAQPSGAIGINGRIGQNGADGVSFYNMYRTTQGDMTLRHSHLGALHLQFTFTYITA